MNTSVSIRLIVIMLVCSMWLSVPTWAQTAGSTIQGTVKDESGGAMPGVTVTVAASELQVGKIAAVTETNGTYRIGDLPAGTYQITFELPGFKTFIQKDFRLAIGFVARVDATLTVGGLEESVTVSGQSPVVDMTTTATSVNFTRETLDSVPAGMGFAAVFGMIPGVNVASLDVGDSNLGSGGTGVGGSSQNYGMAGNGRVEIDGIDMTSNLYLTSATLDEVQVRTSGNSAEVSGPGSSMVAVIKSGSNQFHGSYVVDGERPELQSNNLSAKLRAEGLTSTNPIAYVYDVLGDLGGRLVKDKLWFYGALMRQDRVAGVPGFVVSPTNPTPAHVEARMTYGALKVSYQPTSRTRLIAATQPNMKYQPQGLPPEPSRFVPLSSTLDYKNPTRMWVGELQDTLSTRTVLNVAGGYSGYIGDYAPWRSKFADPDVPGNPSRYDIATQIHTGANPKTWLQYDDHWHLEDSVSLLPEHFLGGHHELKAGTAFNSHGNSVGYRASPAGNYILVTDTINGVRGTPSQIQIINNPAQPVPRLTDFAVYGQDTWKVSERLTLNLGVRVNKIHAFMPRQSRVASPDFPTLFPAQTWDPIDVLTWWSTVPRLGVAWNLAEKTVVKGTFGLYNNGLASVQAVNAFNPNSTVTDTFKWHNVEGDGLYHSDDVNLDPNGLDFLSTTAANGNIVLNRNLKQPMTSETTAGFERELAKNLGFRALYVFKRESNLYTTTNILRPPSAYDIPLTRRDPGPDGVLGTADDGGLVTIYDYAPAYKGAAFVSNTQLNYPSLHDHFQTVEFQVTKRGGRKYSLTAAFWAIKFHQHLVLSTTGFDPSNPNQNANNLDQTYRWAGTVTGSYELPWEVQFGVFVQSKIGIQGQRTVVFRVVDPDGGPSLQQQSTVTVAVDRPGSEYGSALNVVNLRSSKSFQLGASKRLEFDADLFNLLNSSAQTAMTFQSGPSYGYATNVLPARLARLGVKFTF